MKKNFSTLVLTAATVISSIGWISSVHHFQAVKADTRQHVLSLNSGDTIRTKDFVLEYHKADKKNYCLVVYPTQKNQRLVGQQGDGAQGIELINVAKEN